MKARHVLGHILAAALLMTVPVTASSQTANTPKYPPGFNCGAVPAGSERESCNQSQLNPNTDNNGIIDAADPGNAGGAIQTPSDISPPTVPNSPGNNTGGDNGGIGETSPMTP